MSRRTRAKKRVPPPDPVYGSIAISKFINNLMLRGKKTVAESIFYNALDIAVEKLKKPGHEIFQQVLQNVTPMIEVKPRRVGGATYQVPIEVSEERGAALAMRWLIGFARKRTGKSMKERLAIELIDTYNNTGTSIKKKEDTHKMADANRAFAHYRY